MLIKILLSYIAGFMRINVEGYFSSRFINICTQSNILLWNTKTYNSCLFSANISIRDFRKIRKIARNTKCKVTIKNKRGIPFLFERYKKRKILIILITLMIIAMIIISNFVWNIDVECDETINQEEILDIAQKNGLEIGKLKKDIDINKVIRNIRLKRDDIAWAGISINGTNAYIKLVKAEEKPKLIKQDEYCSIISCKEGIITKINVQNGTAVVKPGELVKKGATLVNGWLEGKYTGIRYVHAIADIEAKVWYSKKEKIYKKQEREEKTGKEETKFKIKINNFEINLFKTLSKFQNYDTIVENKKIKLFSDFYLPIELIKVQNYETEKKQTMYTTEELKNHGIEVISQELEKNIDKNKIINKQINFEEQKDFIELEVIYEVLENIGTEERIVF